ncbi:uncharacterized protein LOC135834500 isoform X6 [Planococcus citri]|uniref:uncharacterized protein LOC135834500 isoform X6 n=1 Tax=Planococcus citri TaxID=170843 RepID=UPI0031F877FC
MTETVSNVYDLFYPSPAPLKEISCNALVTALWRWEVENRVRDDRMPDLDIRKNLNPNIPSPIKRIIEECANRFVSFKEKWSVYHHDKLFFDRNDMTSILLNFYDFIFDRNGSIDYIRTAKRIMTCDRLSNDEKFKIACMYCFEDDIRRIWPSVSENLDYDKITFDRSPELYYWVCVLRHGRPDPDDDSVDDPVDDCMFRACTSLHLIITNTQRSQHWSSVEYFWNRIRPESRFQKTNHLSHWERESFVRLMLPKLTNEELERFVLERGSYLIQSLMTKSQYKFYALPTWMYIKNKMNENNFTDLIQSLTYAETNSHKAEDTLDENSAELGARPSTEDQTDLCCEIWRTSPDKLKRSVVGTILTQRYLFCRNIITSTGHREIRFLLALLLDASFKERNGFWKNTWRNLIVATRGKDLHRIMKLCFKGENDIAEFKETSMYDHENIKTYCSGLLREGNFEDFDDILIFCCPDTQKRIDLKQRLLLSCLLSEYFTFSSKLLTRAKLLNDFINDAFDDAEVVADFKNNFMSFPAIVYVLQECIYSGYECSSDHLTRFIDTFVSNEEVTYLLKQRILEYVRNMLLDGHSIRRISADDLQTILVWCLGNEEEVTKFKKLELPMSEFFANEDNWKKCTPLEIKMNDTDVGGFLKWYFRNPEEIDEFNRLFADRFTV